MSVGLPPKAVPIYIFASHRWSHGYRRNGLHDLLSPEWQKNVEFVDLSISSSHPLDLNNRGLALELRNRIRACDVLLPMAGMEANHSEWMKREIDFALAFDKPIIPVVPNGYERLASTATMFATREPVYWRGESLRRAILESVTSAKRNAFHASREARRIHQIQMLAALMPRPIPAPSAFALGLARALESPPNNPLDRPYSSSIWGALR